MNTADDTSDDTSDTGERWRLLVQRTKNAPWLPTTIVTTTSSMCWSMWSATPHLDPSYYALCAERFQVETPC